MSTAVRFDRSEIRKVTKTPQGFVRVNANLTRVGVLSYRRQDGSTVRELRHPDEVFAAASLATLETAPLTDLHPSEMVTPGNVRAVHRGTVRSVKADGRFVAGEVLVQDAELIALVEAGERKELSPGYTCVVDETPGEWQGQKYDAIQRQIVYNHLAIGPSGWGRSGSEVSLRMDGAIMEIENEKIETAEQVTETPAVVAPVVHADAKSDGLQARIDALVAERDSLAAKIATVQSTEEQAKLQARFDSRVKLVVTAMRCIAKITGSEPGFERFDGKSDQEIMSEVVKTHDPKVVLDGKSAAYIEARFDLTIDALAKEAAASKQIAETVRATVDTQATPEPSKVDPFEAFKNRLYYKRQTA